MEKIKIFLVSLFIVSSVCACESDFDCSWGTVCKTNNVTGSGFCVPQEDSYNNDRYIINKNFGGECNKNSDCLVGFVCVLTSGGMGVCMR